MSAGNTVNVDEASLLIAAINTSSLPGLRNRALIGPMVYTSKQSRQLAQGGDMVETFRLRPLLKMHQADDSRLPRSFQRRHFARSISAGA